MECLARFREWILEDPVIWPGIHQDLITLTKLALNALLPPHYAINTGERLYVVEAERSIYPDVAVFERAGGAGGAPGGSGAGAAVASDPPWVLLVEPVEVREVFLEIMALQEGKRVVTTLEVLSFTNKLPRSDGRRLYLTKQQELLPSQVHLIEVDLLRNTEHIIRPPREPREELLRKGRWDYLVSLHRGGTGPRYEVSGFTVRQRLPRIRVPLAGGDPDIVLDLQAVFDRAYDEGGYARLLDYRREPRSPLAGDDAAWAHALLKDRGLR